MTVAKTEPTADAVGTFGRRLSRLRQQPLLVITLLLLLLILVTFIIYPIYQILAESFRSDGQFSLANYQRFFASRYFQHTLYNTLTISFLATIGAVLLGLIFAFGVTRTTMPGKKFFMLISILPLITPPFFAAFAFILLLGRQGLFNQFLFSLFGIRWVIYGWHGVIIAQVITLFPIAFLNLTAALSSIDPRLEEAAEDLGGSFWYVMRRVTMPLLTPAFFSSALLILMFNLSAFGIPAILAGNNLFWRNASMLAPEAFFQILGFFDWGMGATLAVILLLPSLALFLFQGWYIPRRSYITVSGIPTAFAARPSPRYLEWIIFGICTLVSLLVISLYVVIFMGAFTETWGVNYSLTMRHINLMFRVGSDSIRNSMLLSIGGGMVAASLGALIAFVVTRWRFPGRQAYSFVAMLPYALPGTAMGLGFAAGFNVAPLLLTGTWMIILIDYAIRRMPFGIESSKSALSQIDVSLEEAGADMGANWPVVFRRITLPLLRPTFVAAFTFCFIKAMTDITSVIFLVSPRWKVMSVDIYNYISAGRMGAAASMSSLMVVLIVILLAIVWKVSGLGYRIFKL
jgi:iron(III) transport system permease protein